MRYITIQGQQYPIQATVAVEAANNSRMRKALLDAEARAELEGKAEHLPEEQTQERAAVYRKKALKTFLADAENSLQLWADLINAAVERAKVLDGRDISASVPHYPLTARKLAFLVTAADLNDEQNALAVAQELVECRGGDPKNLQAGHLLLMSAMWTSRL